MPARIVEVRNGVRELIKAAIAARNKPDSTSVQSVMFSQQDLEVIKGRQVLCFTDGWSQPDAASRKEDFIDYRIRIVVMNRHSGKLEDREAWAEAELEWVDAVIWPLTDARKAFLLTALWCQSAEVLTDYDADWLMKKSMFFHELLTTWREAK
jgi:hypothetical protein